MGDVWYDGRVGRWRCDRMVRGMKEVREEKMWYSWEEGKRYDLNSGEKVKRLVIKGLVCRGELKEIEE